MNMKTILSELDKNTLSEVLEGYDILLFNEKKEYEEANRNDVFNPVIEEIENKRKNAKKLFRRLYNNKK